MIIPAVLASRRRSTPPGLWTPANLSTPALIWLDHESAITEDSGLVTSWADRSGAGRTFAASGIARPTAITTELGGIRVIRFNGSSNRMMRTDANLLRNVGAAWLLTVYRRRSTTTGYRRLFSCVYNASGFSRFSVFSGDAGSQNAPWYQSQAVGGGSELSVYPASPPAVDAWGINLCLRGFAAGTAGIRINGTSRATQSGISTGLTSDVANAQEIVIGGNAQGSQWSDVDIACVILGDVLPSTGEIEKLEGWAAWNYDLVGNLPVGHPYKTTPPLA